MVVFSSHASSFVQEKGSKHRVLRRIESIGHLASFSNGVYAFFGTSFFPLFLSLFYWFENSSVRLFFPLGERDQKRFKEDVEWPLDRNKEKRRWERGYFFLKITYLQQGGIDFFPFLHMDENGGNMREMVCSTY